MAQNEFAYIFDTFHGRGLCVLRGSASVAGQLGLAQGA